MWLRLTSYTAIPSRTRDRISFSRLVCPLANVPCPIDVLLSCTNIITIFNKKQSRDQSPQNDLNLSGYCPESWRSNHARSSRHIRRSRRIRPVEVTLAHFRGKYGKPGVDANARLPGGWHLRKTWSTRRRMARLRDCGAPS